MTQIFWQWLIYVVNGLNICERASIRSKRLNYIGNGIDMRIYGLTMWGKKLRFVRNGLNMWEMHQICGEMTTASMKCLKYVGIDLNTL